MNKLGYYKILSLLIYLLSIDLSLLAINSENFSSYGQSFFVGLITILVTYYFTSYFLNYEKSQRWNKINKSILNNLNEQLTGIFIEINNYAGIDTTVICLPNTNEKEISKIIRKKRLNQIKEISLKKNFKIIKEYKEHIIKGNLGTIFKRREEYLNQFQLKYLEYFKAEVIISLMNLQNALYLIDQEIVIRNKQVNNNWIRLNTDEQIISNIESNMQKIVDILQFLIEKKIFYYK
jgi:hypothetical protein